MASRIRVDKDGDGTPDISPPRPHKLKSLDDEVVGRESCSPVKSALKGGTKTKSAESPDSFASPKAPKSALKSALKTAAIPDSVEEPEPEIPAPPQQPPSTTPAPRPQKSALKKRASEESATIPSPQHAVTKKSALKKREPEPPPSPSQSSPTTPAPRPKKSALKKAAPPPPERQMSEDAVSSPSSKASSRHGSKASVSSSHARSPSGKLDRRTASRPSLFKMTTGIEEESCWTVRGLARHYFHFAMQKTLWDQNVHEADEAGQRRSRRSMKVADLLPLPGVEMSPVEPAQVPVEGISPLKVIFIEKKPDAEKVRSLLASLSVEDRAKWVNAPLDATPPPMPAPLFFAVAGVHTNLVQALLEYDVDVTAQYPGKSMLKGWVKPNVPLVESCAARKGRFVGTMLGDKLECIEQMLIKAKKAKDGDPTSPKRSSEATPKGQRRKSFQMKCRVGVMDHTHDHPSSKYELVDDPHAHNSGPQDQPQIVREAVHIDSGEVYAIKAGSKVDDVSVTDPEAALWNEIGIIRKLDHPNIVRLHETFENDTHIFMVLEGCLGGGLFDRMVSDGVVEEPAALRLAYQIGSAIRHLHQLQICHRDLQPEAVFLAECGPLIETGVKIIDFSTSREFSSTSRMTTKVCTLHYVAPEILSSDNGYTEKVDIWAYGVLLYTMISGTPPFNAEQDLDILSLVKEGKYDFTPAGLWAGINDDTKDLISKCLTVDEDKRPDMWGVMDHKAMTDAEADGAVYTASATLGRANDQSKDKSAANAVNMVKATFSMIAEVISDKQVTELRDLFKRLDYQDTGMIELEESVNELKDMVQDNSEATQLLKLLNTGGITGRVNYLMYMATMTDRRRQLRREASRAVYNMLDLDKNGAISLYEIAQALEKPRDLDEVLKFKGVSMKEVQKIWAEMKEVFIIPEEDHTKLGSQLPDRELTFDEFFKELPLSKDDSVF